MPFGAHESMQVHEVLNEQVCLIDHLAMCAKMCSDPALLDLMHRHHSHAMHHYNQLVSYTHDYRAVVPTEVQFSQVTSPRHVQYGLRNPAPVTPMGQGQFSDLQIARSLLLAHKNSAKNQMCASLECADPYVRQLLLNGANSCNYQAYEVFEYLNARGQYQVPTMNEHTAKTYLHAFQTR
ncbi:spore coat protein [Tumebacillus algifaecis]|uniref:Spore coat protein n=1 Tax=Tumebacillus algifaecis TaxID=1214604 RepID=A0A223D3D1_9BACL|nr:spore coat protein [Tumebacillus algifaecis]ASS76005.1 spore coat protein [Tumebacillus algifaecis]